MESIQFSFTWNENFVGGKGRYAQIFVNSIMIFTEADGILGNTSDIF